MRCICHGGPRVLSFLLRLFSSFSLNITSILCLVVKSELLNRHESPFQQPSQKCSKLRPSSLDRIYICILVIVISFLESHPTHLHLPCLIKGQAQITRELNRGAEALYIIRAIDGHGTKIEKRERNSQNCMHTARNEYCRCIC